MEDDVWMARALALADKAQQLGEVPVGAVLVQNGVLIAQAYNTPIGSHDATAHAEIDAIRQACKTQKNYRLPNTTLYVTLEPCTMCVGAIIHARVSRVVFGAREPKSGAVISQNNLLNHSN